MQARLQKGQVIVVDVEERGGLAQSQRQIPLALESGPVAGRVADGAQALEGLALASVERWIDVDEVDAAVSQASQDIQIVSLEDLPGRLAY